jgi:hypothetical protein
MLDARVLSAECTALLAAGWLLVAVVLLLFMLLLASSSGFLFARRPLPLQLGQNSRLAKDF